MAALRDPLVWAFAVVSLAPAALWYAHANGFWTTYGNSLGGSNEDHWIGPYFFTDPKFADGILKAEVFYVWTPAGLLVALFGVVAGGLKEPVRLALWWAAATLALYVLAARSLGAEWSLYYHVVSVPPAALLFGAGLAQLPSIGWRPRWPVAAATVGPGLVAIVAAMRLRHVAPGFGAGYAFQALIVIAVAIGLALMLSGRREPASVPGAPGRLRAPTPILGGFVGLLAVALTFTLQAREIREEAHPAAFQPTFACARQFVRDIPADALIVSTGGPCRDRDGYALQHNYPVMFYLMDRRGFTMCVQDQSVPALRALAGRGAKFFVARKFWVQQQPGFEADLRAAFPLVAECSEWLLFDLAGTPAKAGEPRPAPGTGS